MSAIGAGASHLQQVLHRGGVIKICGLREPPHAAAAAAAGADLIGFIFAPARRQVTAHVARTCVTAAREAAPDGITAVGVFVDASAEEIIAVIGEAGLDAVQLHGAEPVETVGALPVPALKVFRPLPQTTDQELIAELDTYASAPVPPVAFMIEGYSPLGAGGTGAATDWDFAAVLARQRSFLLGGGLDPSNVGRAIARVRPAGVDVSSGVEISGVKDPALIRRFVSVARESFQARPCR